MPNDFLRGFFTKDKTLACCEPKHPVFLKRHVLVRPLSDDAYRVVNHQIQPYPYPWVPTPSPLCSVHFSLQCPPLHGKAGKKRPNSTHQPDKNTYMQSTHKCAHKPLFTQS